MARFRRHSAPKAPPNAADAADFEDLRATLARAIHAKPIDEPAVRRAVWTYVGAERNAGTRPGVVIMALTDLLEKASVTPLVEREALTRRVILWCVEAYFGHLGGEGVGEGDGAMAIAR